MAENREGLSKAFFEIREQLTRIDYYQRVARDYPSEISKEEDIAISSFLKDAEPLMSEAFDLFINMTEK